MPFRLSLSALLDVNGSRPTRPLRSSGEQARLRFYCSSPLLLSCVCISLVALMALYDHKNTSGHPTVAIKLLSVFSHSRNHIYFFTFFFLCDLIFVLAKHLQVSNVYAGVGHQPLRSAADACVRRVRLEHAMVAMEQGRGSSYHSALRKCVEGCAFTLAHSAVRAQPTRRHTEWEYR